MPTRNDVPVDGVCPFLAPIVADWLWLYPTSEYCARPDHRVRVPGRTTIARVCNGPAYRDCEGYKATQAAA